jgi:hypothetical protein
MKRYSAANTPFVKASVVVGIGGLKRVLYQAVVKLSGRNIATLDTVDEAKDWLAAQ